MDHGADGRRMLRLDIRNEGHGGTMIEETNLSEDELSLLGHLIPDPEPVVVPKGSQGASRIIRVCEPRLDGNELRYLTECIQSTWISSAGSFVQRFEAAFA